ncbi:MAG TPA: methionine--tRNA ligase subunit beta, partial [Blastocatellia bacterium]|nr:methionine--tRNA ligase subunit beta [Blastocatellia bacterium]
IDKMISDAKPWELVKDERQAETLNAVLYRAAETLRWIGAMVYPVMPGSAEQIFAQLGLGDDLSRLDPATLKWGGLEAGAAIGAAEGIFPRIDKSKIMSEIKESIPSETPVSAGGQSEPPVSADAQAETHNFITIDDFIKVDLRVGEIKVAERVPNADKLLRFEVDLGEEKPRQILAGLAEYYDPEPLVGRKVVVVANLKPRKMRGLESQGMICAASLEDGTGEKPALATFIENVNIGARLK